MNPWQPMIDRCKEMDRKINNWLITRADSFTINNIDEIETVLYAVGFVANSLGAMKMGAGQQGKINPCAGAEPLSARATLPNATAAKTATL